MVLLQRHNKSRPSSNCKACQRFKHDKTYHPKIICWNFYPLGIIEKVMIFAKIVLHVACLQKIGWDDKLDETLKRALKGLIKGLIECKRIKSARCVYIHVPEGILECSLHSNF